MSFVLYNPPGNPSMFLLITVGFAALPILLFAFSQAVVKFVCVGVSSFDATILYNMCIFGKFILDILGLLCLNSIFSVGSEYSNLMSADFQSLLPEDTAHLSVKY